jgi:O-antigen/teichoic acid export membrane protein
MSKKIFVNIFSNYTLRAVNILLNLVAIPVLVKTVGQEAFGLLILANLTVGYFHAFDFGLPSAVTKYVAEFQSKKDPEKVNEIINSSLGLFLLIGLVVAIILLVFVFLGGLKMLKISPENFDQAKILFYTASLFALVSWPRLVLEGAFRGIQQYHKLNLVIGVGRAVAIGSALIGAAYAPHLAIIFVLFNIDRVLGFVWLYHWLKRSISSWRFRLETVKISTLKWMFTFSLWLMLGKLAVMFEYQSDQFIIGAFLPVAMITVYTITVYPFMMIQQFSGLAASTIMPAVSARYAAEGEGGISDFKVKGARYHNIAVAVFALTGFFLAKPFIGLWMGEEYLPYAWIAQLTCLFQAIWQSNAFIGEVCTGMGLSKRPGILAIFIGLSNLFFSLLLVQFIGMPGVIWGTIIAGLIGVVLFNIFIFPVMGVPRVVYLKNIFLKGQLSVWLSSTLLLSIWRYLQEIDNWFALFTSALFVFTFLTFSGLAFSLSKEDKILFKNGIIKLLLNKTTV